MPITVAIIEDMKPIAADLKSVINAEEGMECQQVYHTAEEALAFLPNFPVDVVLSDIGLPGKSGIEAIKILSEKCVNTQFCMFTIFEDNERIFESLKAGAKGYILKNSSPLIIISALKELYNGGSPMSPEIARSVVDAFVQDSQPSRNIRKEELPLTEREYQLLELLSTGMLYREIGSALEITEGTVKQHIHKIYHKLQVNNKTQAIEKLKGR